MNRLKSTLQVHPKEQTLKKELDEIYSTVKEIPMFIGGKEVKSDRILPIFPPIR